MNILKCLDKKELYFLYVGLFFALLLALSYCGLGIVSVVSLWLAERFIVIAVLVKCIYETYDAYLRLKVTEMEEDRRFGYAIFSLGISLVIILTAVLIFA